MKKILSLLLVVIFQNQILGQNVHFAWAEQFGETGDEAAGYCNITDPAGNLYITGTFQGRIDADPGPAVVSLRSGNNRFGKDMYVCKLSPSGSLIWARQMGGGAAEERQFRVG
jgi:hypothetical protein